MLLTIITLYIYYNCSFIDYSAFSCTAFSIISCKPVKEDYVSYIKNRVQMYDHVHQLYNLSNMTKKAKFFQYQYYTNASIYYVL